MFWGSFFLFLSTIMQYPQNIRTDLAINLPASKSESNRALIIQALAYQQSGAKITLHNLSEANDTLVLKNILATLSADKTAINAQDAGTAFRFLTAYLAITAPNVILTGTPRMQERPIGILVEALRTLGADLAYVGKEGFPPLRIGGFKQKTDSIDIQADTSSQFISALLMIAPLLPEGLRLRLVGKVASKPYIEMTLAQMAHFGISAKTDWKTQKIHISPQQYQEGSYTIESDWSAASYWYSALAMLTPEFCPNVVAMSKGRGVGKVHILLKGLRADSLQGDKILTELMPYWSVKSEFVEDGVIISNVSPTLPPHYELDFTDFPDLAQTIIPLISHYQTPRGPWQVRYPDHTKWSLEFPMPTRFNMMRAWRFKGLESLRIKETDRITALQTELYKFGFELYEAGKANDGEPTWALRKLKNIDLPTPLQLQTYHDHRMAMGFAPLLIRHDFEILQPEVVQKSYPFFWDEWRKFYDFVKSYL